MSLKPVNDLIVTIQDKPAVLVAIVSVIALIVVGYALKVVHTMVTKK